MSAPGRAPPRITEDEDMSHHDTRHPRPGFEKQNWFRGGPNVDGTSPGYPPAPTPAPDGGGSPASDPILPAPTTGTK